MMRSYYCVQIRLRNTNSDAIFFILNSSKDMVCIWTVYKGGQCAKWCHMQQLGPGRLHRFSVSSRPHSQWTLWGLWLGRRSCGHGGSQPDRHWEGLPQLGRFSARWCIPATCNIRSGVIWIDNLQKDVDLCQVLPRLWSSLLSRSLGFSVLRSEPDLFSSAEEIG